MPEHSRRSTKNKGSKNDHNQYDDSKTYTSDQLYHKLKRIQKRIEKCYEPICLRQSDFDDGTYIIDRPGYYILEENIVFGPNPNDDYLPRPNQEKYSSAGFVLGFFAAIVIQTENVYLDLNGYTIEQSPEFALQQRFFAVIELASAPFALGQGPGDFGSDVKNGKNVIIRNGTIGRSSHHGIHGNFPKWVLFEKPNITDFEIAAIAINGSDSVVMNNLNIHDTRTNVPVLGTYSAARFARMFANVLLSKYSNQLNDNQKIDLENTISKLEVIMNQTYTEVINTGETSVKLFRNENGLPDGNNYGILFHPPGVAVDDFITENKNLDWTRNVYLNEVNVKNIKGKINEIIALSKKDGTGAQVDVAGAVLQIANITDENGKYKPNPLANLQILMAKISLDLGIQLGKNNITQDTIDWAYNNTNISELLDLGYKYKCNGDSMFHVNKGVNCCRFDGVNNMEIRNCILDTVENYGYLGNEKYDGAYVTSHDQQKRPGYCGADTTGVIFSYCKNISICDLDIKNIKSMNGNAVAISMINESRKINIDNFDVKGVSAGTLQENVWLGQNYDGEYVHYTVGMPNDVPDAIGVYVSKDSKKVRIGKRSIDDLSAPGCEVPIWTH